MPSRTLANHVKDLSSLTRLVAGGTIATSRMAEDLQRRIDAPFRALPLLGRVTDLVYGSVRNIAALTGGVAGLCSQLLADVSDMDEPGSVRERLLSALNGVLGDQLHAAANSLAIGMQLRGVERLSKTKSKNRRYAIFVHGLCMTDADWADAAHPAALRECGYEPLFLRYNTGLAIADNGAALAQLLDSFLSQAARSAVDQASIVVVAHSMGGLVLRHAIHQAQKKGMRWPDLLHACVYLGTPHLGAPLERGGHWLAKQWARVPFAAALAPVANVRSQGIQDLHSGYVVPDSAKRGRQKPRTWPVGAAPSNYFIAACLSSRPSAKAYGAKQSALDNRAGALWLGDGLVPVESALAGQLDTDDRHVLFFNAGHIDLLSLPSVSTQLKAWVSAKSSRA